jgi:hypothetical protein
MLEAAAATRPEIGARRHHAAGPFFEQLDHLRPEATSLPTDQAGPCQVSRQTVREEQRTAFELRHTIAAGTETLDPDLNLPAAARACLASHVTRSFEIARRTGQGVV